LGGFRNERHTNHSREKSRPLRSKSPRGGQKTATTADKAATLNAEIETTNLSGGVLALTSANCTPKGAQVAGTEITGNNAFTATQKISIEASSVTAFAEGAIWLMIGYTRP